MRAAKVSSLTSSDASPNSDLWTRAPAYGLTLTPVPVAAVDTSPYVRRAFRNVNAGAISSVNVQAVSDGRRLSLRMEWEDLTEDAHTSPVPPACRMGRPLCFR